VGSRTRARECALQALYQLDTSGGSAEQALSGLFAHFEEVDADARSFAEELVRGVTSERPAIDEIIQRYSQNWKLERMARVDRNVLRLGVFELLRCAEVPVRVTLNEAVELGKKFGSEESSAFVNGVLDRIAHGKEMAQAAPKTERDGKD
jgi:N utilization substance protein B